MESCFSTKSSYNAAMDLHGEPIKCFGIICKVTNKVKHRRVVYQQIVVIDTTMNLFGGGLMPCGRV